MRSGVALFFALTLAGCGGTVSDPGQGVAGRTPEGAGPVSDSGPDPDPGPVADQGEGGSLAEAGGAPPADAAGGSPVRPDLAGAAGSDVERGGAAAGGRRSSLSGSGGAPGSTITRTLVDAPLAPRGFLSGMQYRSGAESTSVFTIDAIFETTRGQWDGCTQVQLDQCWYYDCPPGSAPFLPSVPLQNAGAVSLTTASVPSTTVEVGLLYEYWYEANAQGELWPTSGKKLTFAATGSTAPAFSLDVRSPPTVVLTSLNGAATPTDITRSEGADLRWTASGSGIAYFSLHGFYERKFAAVCEFDAVALAGKLPAVLLQELEPGSDYRLTFRGMSRAHATVDGWELDAGLAGYGGPSLPYDPPVVALH